MNLYELTGAYLSVLAQQDELDEQTLIDTLESIQGSMEDKVENIVKLMRTLEAEAETIKQEEKRLYKMRKARENKAKSLKRYLEEQMKTMGMKRMNAGLFNVRIQKNAPSLHITDESKLSSHYYIEQPAKLDKRSILDELKQGIEIDGVEMVQSESLRIN